MNASNYKQAIADFKAFLTTNPKSLYAEHAQYWIGESYFAMRDFTAAIAEFQNVIKKYPESIKVPSSLFKQGMAFFEMQSYDEAKAFFAKLTTRFPATNEAIRAQEQIQTIDKFFSSIRMTK